MPDVKQLVIEVVGEGITELGPTAPGNPQVQQPDKGVLPILLHRLCGEPNTLKVKCRKLAFLQGKKRVEEKVAFAKRQAPLNGSHGFVCVLDTDGAHPEKLDALTESCARQSPTFPCVLGVAHTSIEAWLMGDPSAIRKGLRLNKLACDPPADPENLPAAYKRDGNDPKLALAKCCWNKPDVVSSDQMWEIAKFLKFDRVRAACPVSFAPFEAAVVEVLRPMFIENATGDCDSAV